MFWWLRKHKKKFKWFFVDTPWGFFTGIILVFVIAIVIGVSIDNANNAKQAQELAQQRTDALNQVKGACSPIVYQKFQASIPGVSTEDVQNEARYLKNDCIHRYLYRIVVEKKK